MSFFEQLFIEKFGCAPRICLAEKGIIGISPTDLAVLDNLRNAVDVVNIIMAYDNGVDFA